VEKFRTSQSVINTESTSAIALQVLDINYGLIFGRKKVRCLTHTD